MKVLDFLVVIAPHLTENGDQNRLLEAVQVAEIYRPACLPDDKQALAVAYYTAYLLESQQERQRNPMGITAEREGDLSRSYDATNTNAAKFYAKWKELNDICLRAKGAITVGFNYGGDR